MHCHRGLTQCALGPLRNAFHPLSSASEVGIGLKGGTLIYHLVAEANPNPVPSEASQITYWLLAHNHALHSLHLGHMVIIGPKFTPLDSLVDTHQEVSRDVFTIVNPWLGGITKIYGINVGSGWQGFSTAPHTRA